MAARNGQYSTEYVIIIGIGVGLIASFVVYVVFFYGSFASTSAANDITGVANTLATEANYVTAQGTGSMQTFPITIPLLEQHYSFFCGNIIKLQTPAQLGVARPAENISGMLPLSGGTYNAFVRAGNGGVLVGLRFAVSTIEQSYLVTLSSGSPTIATLHYTLNFYNYSFEPVPTAVAYNLSVFTADGTYITSITNSTASPAYSISSGEITLPSAIPAEYVVEVTPSSSGDYASTCINVP